MDTSNMEEVFVPLIQVQTGATEAQAKSKLMECGFKAFMIFLQTQDKTKAMAAFVGCLFGVNTPVNPNEPGSGETIHPDSVNRVVFRC